MSKTIEHLFDGGSRRLFWVLAPLLVLFGVMLPFSARPGCIEEYVIVWSTSVLSLFLVLVMYDPKRFHTLARIIAGTVFLFLAFWVSFEYGIISKGIFGSRPMGGDSSTTVLGAFVTIGLPCLLYAVLGRVRLGRPKSLDDEDRAAR